MASSLKHGGVEGGFPPLHGAHCSIQRESASGIRPCRIPSRNIWTCPASLRRGGAFFYVTFFLPFGLCHEIAYFLYLAISCVRKLLVNCGAIVPPKQCSRRVQRSESNGIPTAHRPFSSTRSPEPLTRSLPLANKRAPGVTMPPCMVSRAHSRQIIMNKGIRSETFPIEELNFVSRIAFLQAYIASWPVFFLISY